MTDSKYSTDRLEKDMLELKIESRIQTVAIILFFFFGVSTIRDLVKKGK